MAMQQAPPLFSSWHMEGHGDPKGYMCGSQRDVRSRDDVEVFLGSAT